MAGDKQTDLFYRRSVTGDAQHAAVLHLNLVELNGVGKPELAQTSVASTKGPIQLADSTVQLNGRHAGPTSDNPYTQPVAPAFRPGGKPLETGINSSSKTTTTWNSSQVDRGQAYLKKLGEKQQAEVHAVAYPSQGTGENNRAADGTIVHHLDKFGAGFSALMSVSYAHFIHPSIQRVGVPAQLAADARASAGSMTRLGKTVDYIPKAYLKAFSPTYLELEKLRPVNTASFGMISTKQIKTFENAAKAGKGAWTNAWNLGKEVGVPLVLVAAESSGQIAAARSLGDNDNISFMDHRRNDLARIIQPTVPGATAKALALMLSSSAKTSVNTFLGAQLYEAESNMTRPERLGTAIVGLAPAGIALLAKSDKRLALGLAVADAGISAAAEITSDFWFKDDKSVPSAAKAIKDISSNPEDISQGALQNGVDQMKAVGKEDSFLLTQIYDRAHTKAAQAQATDSSSAQQAKYKLQVILGQAQGETILENGLTQSQYWKMQSREVAIPDPSDHKEQYRIAPTQRIDIGGQATRTLIGAIGSANLLEWAAAKQGNDADGVEKQKQEMKDILKDLLTQPHQSQIEKALKESTWGFGKTVNDYNLVQFWKHNNSDYAHINTLIRDTANYYATMLPRMEEKLATAKEALEQAQANPASETAVAEKQALYNARKDAFGLTTLWIGKLYRDEALMKLGQAQSMIQNLHDGNTASSADIIPQLQLAATALANSDKYAPGNPDAKILGMMTATMYKAVGQDPETNSQPNP